MQIIPIEWFGGNFEGVELFVRLASISHVYDDFIDGDEVTNAKMHELMYNVLVDLNKNSLYRKYLDKIVVLWELVLSSYQVANIFEKQKENHGLEIAHGLRYTAGHIIALIMIEELGREKALKYLPDMWRVAMNERIDDYLIEHGGV